MTATSGSTAGLAAALRSAPVAITIGIAGWAIVAYVLLGQAAKSDGQFGIDFADYHAAATRMAAGDSPYAPDMLEGPIPSQGQDRYRYPPVFAALLIPLTGLSAATAAAVWLATGLAATLFAVVLPVVRPVWRGGVTPVLWAIALAGWFFPVLDGLLKGNVDGLIALAAAVLLVGSSGSGGVATGAGGVLKLTPILGAVPLARRSLRSVGVLGVTILVLVVPTMVLWPQAWRDYAVVLPNLIDGSSSGAGGLAPAALLEASGTPLSGLAPGVRTLTLIGVAIALLASWFLAGPRGSIGPTGSWPAAVLLTAVAGLLLPAAIWYHYLCVLLPFIVLGWGKAGGRARAAILAGIVLIDLALVWIPLATIGATLIVVALLAPSSGREATGRPAAV